jgi:hypothetical protein
MLVFVMIMSMIKYNIYIYLNGNHRLFLVMGRDCVLFAVRTDMLHAISMHINPKDLVFLSDFAY